MKCENCGCEIVVLHCWTDDTNVKGFMHVCEACFEALEDEVHEEGARLLQEHHDGQKKQAAAGHAYAQADRAEELALMAQLRGFGE